ncbi:MAG: radical SAM family heme chaperone HemW [Pseudomonadota bacterium]
MDYQNYRKKIMDIGGLYIHVPFCLSKCPYCDFYSQTNLDLIPSYLSALKKEMALTSSFAAIQGVRGVSERKNPAISTDDNRIPPEGIGVLRSEISRTPNGKPLPSFDTIYLGGGTPSLLKPAEIAEIIEAAYRFFTVSRKAEISLEANPGTISAEYLKEIKTVGINRINIGIQSFKDKTLKFLGRIHSAQESHDAISNARGAGFKNMGLDLIYGLASQSKKDWIDQLQTATSYSPEHLSCYMLTFEPGTLFDTWKKSGKIRGARDATLRSLFETTIEVLEKSGHIYYETSNFAKSRQYQSRHNKKYWSHTPYLGLGPSAHSFQEPVRYWNHRSLERYIHDLNKGIRPVAGQENLDDDALLLERVYLGLRTAQGISIKTLNKRFGIDFCRKFASVLSALGNEGNISLTPERCILTPKGRVFCDGIAARLMTS